MHIKNQNTFLLIILILFTACSSNKENEKVSTEKGSKAIDEFTSYDLVNETETRTLTELIEHIEFSRLQETDESLISSANNYLMHRGLIVFRNGAERDICVFTESGEFVRRFNRSGEGPEEYSTVNDMWFDGDYLAIYSKGRYVKWYDLEGNFIRSKSMDLQAGHIYPYQDGYVVDASYLTLDDSLRFNFAFVDSEFKTQKVFLPSGDDMQFQVFMANSSLMPDNGKILFNRMMSDTVYSFNATEFEPFIHYDFGNEWYFKNMTSMPNNMFIDMQNSGKVWNVSSKISSQFIWLSTYGGEPGRNKYLIDRGNNKSIRVDTRKGEEYYALSPSLWENEKLFGSIQSIDVPELISSLGQDQYSFNEGTTLEEIKSSENPVLVKIKFKDSSEW